MIMFHRGGHILEPWVWKLKLWWRATATAPFPDRKWVSITPEPWQTGRSLTLPVIAESPSNSPSERDKSSRYITPWFEISGSSNPELKNTVFWIRVNSGMGRRRRPNVPRSTRQTHLLPGLRVRRPRISGFDPAPIDSCLWCRVARLQIKGSHSTTPH